MNPLVPLIANDARPTLADIGDPRVLAEQVKSLYAQLPFSMTGTTLGCFVIAAVMWGRTPTPMLAAWLGCVLLNQAWRLVVLQRFRHLIRVGGIGPHNAKRWCRWWMFGAFVSGLLFGFAGYWFFSGGSEVHEIALIIILFLMCAGAVPLLATYPPSLYVFIVPALGPIAARMIFDGGSHVVIGAIVAISVVIMLFLGRHYGRLLIESIQMRFANVDLIGALSREKTAADAAREEAELANQSKTRFFAAASHDLRQPLHAMGLFAGALRSRVREPELVNMVASINASVEALENQFNELLDI
jgi:two-component system, sensor histidine kinase